MILAEQSSTNVGRCLPDELGNVLRRRENLANSIPRIQIPEGTIKCQQMTTSENNEDDVTKRSPSVYTNQWPIVHVECDHVPSSHDDKCDYYDYEA